MLSILDATFNGMGGSEMYRSQLVPEAFPKQKPMRFENWSEEDLVMYVGGEYAKAAA
ncbi:hypothetical protein AVV06_gp47 [Mycobacterium phage Chadwick]|uniref:Uncharacterized protein n=2 Tax=Benedictvirus TaxID=2946819 RepID=A0A2P1N2E1_9CAUD|nr:hypothetical protein AVV06_gp47 [Mycobacterium phage Chadwick]YP_010060670.1 hypothetical protein KIP48_gp47 [Mycobacterium phage Naca]ALA06775.1 hypothetical protein SEA_CHADWICK_48 [Mycobacterium phage Chadwick]AVP42084.1 hypothetical protein SEA_NACA_46 [Mycobacterium phage Naca]